MAIEIVAFESIKTVVDVLLVGIDDEDYSVNWRFISEYIV